MKHHERSRRSAPLSLMALLSLTGCLPSEQPKSLQPGAIRSTLSETPIAESEGTGSGAGSPPDSSPAPIASPHTECATPSPDWIWCDDFEQDRLARYFEHSNPEQSFVRAPSVGMGGSQGMRARFRTGQIDAGSLKLAFGRTPQNYFRPVDGGTQRYREIYWRVFVRYPSTWVGGGGDKLSRATSFASSQNWAQAMIAPVWSGASGGARDYLYLDPASGTDANGTLRTSTYNDFNQLRWLGAASSATPIFASGQLDRWHCIETRVRLNDPGTSNGVYALWINGMQEAVRNNLNWVGGFAEYGINAVFLENYWNQGSPANQERFFDRFVVSTRPIGCGPAHAAGTAGT